MMLGGLVCLTFCGGNTLALGVALALSILLYDAVHKLLSFSPVLMGSCRFFLYLTASSCGVSGVTGWAVWAGLALTAYIAGLSYFARRESSGSPLAYWPLLLLYFPCALSLIMNTGAYRQDALLLSLILGLWVARCARFTMGPSEKQVGRAVSGLLAGIVFVDWLAITDGAGHLGFLFIALFILALAFQRFVPAT